MSSKQGLARPWRLHHQLIVVVSVLMLLAIGMLGGFTAVQQGRTVLGATQAQAATLARNVAISASNPLLTDSLDVLEELVLRSADFQEVQEIRILSAVGQVLTHVRRDGGGQARLVFDPLGFREPLPKGAEAVLLPGAAEDSRLVVWHPVQAGGLVGWVRVDYSTASVDQLKAQIWTSTALVAVLSVGVCGLILLRFLHRPMRALRQATEFAVGLNQVQGQALVVDRGTAEIASLGGALNEASLRLHQQMLALHEQNECLGAIFSLSPDGLLTFDPLGRVQFVNQAFMTLTGLRREQVEGASAAQLDEALRQQLPAGHAFAGIDACFDRQDTGQPLRLSLQQGHGLRVLTLVGQRSDAASVSKVLYVCDVTQQQRLDQMKSDFLALAAHELRTPITSIYGYTELMMMRQLPVEQMRDLTGRVHAQTQVMMSILNELLDLARIEAKRGADLVWQHVDLAQAVSNLMRDFSPPTGREPVQIAPSSAPLPVQVDQAKLRQMLVNLLSNAYKYSPRGGAVSLSFASQSGPGGVVRHGVILTDRGIGMQPEHLAHMGERFFRVDKSGHIPGTGLGVSIVKELAELMGAEVVYSSEWEIGTTVTLWFAAAPQA